MDKIKTYFFSSITGIFWVVLFNPYQDFNRKKILDPLRLILVPEISLPSTNPALSFPIPGKSVDNIISHYGEPRARGKRVHKGMDIPADKGTPVVAVEDGIIQKTVEKGNGGKQIWMKGKDRIYYYAHLDNWSVKEGEKVKKGQKIGTVGNSGNASKTMPHLHFGVYIGKGKTIDPILLDWL